jgi:hypothetical protein
MQAAALRRHGRNRELTSARADTCRPRHMAAVDETKGVPCSGSKAGAPSNPMADLAAQRRT